MITQPLTLIIAILAPILAVAISKIIDSSKLKNNSGVGRMLEEEKLAFEGIVEEKLAEVRDNAIDLDIAVKKANALSKILETDIAKLSPRIESYKDYEAAISRYQGQVEALEEAHLEILNRLDTVLKERHTIDKTYKRISDVKAKMLDLETNINTVQKRLVDSYKSKFDEFENELNSRFDVLTKNLIARNSQYDAYAEKEKEHIAGIVKDFEEAVFAKEALFTKHLTDLAERAAKENILQLSDLFESGREEFLVKYDNFAAEINSKAYDIESKFDDLSTSKEKLEEELNSLHYTIRDRLDKIAKDSTKEFSDNIEKTMSLFTSSLREEVMKLNEEKEAMFEAVTEKADMLENSITEKVHGMEDMLMDLEDNINSRTLAIEENISKKVNEIDIDLEDKVNELKNTFEIKKSGIELVIDEKASQIDKKLSAIEEYSKNIFNEYEENAKKVNDEFDTLRTEVRDRLASQIEVFTLQLKDALENENTGVMTLYNNKRLELEDLLSKVNTMSNETLLQANGRIDEIKAEFESMRAMMMEEVAISFNTNFEVVKGEVDSKIEALNERINEISTFAKDVISNFENKKDYITSSIGNKIDEQTEKCIDKLKSEFDSMRALVEEDINLYIDKVSKDILHSEEMMKDILEKFDTMKESADTFEGEVKNNISDKIEDLKGYVEELEENVLSYKSSLDDKITELNDFVESSKNSIDTHSKEHIDTLKEELTNIFERETKDRIALLQGEIDKAFFSIAENEQAQKETKDIIEQYTERLKNEIDKSIVENDRLTNEIKNNILSLVNSELDKATVSINTLVSGRVEEINSVKAELEDMLHRVEEGRDVVEKNIHKVYDKIDERERELFERVLGQYSKIDEGVNSLFERIKEKEDGIVSGVKEKCLALQNNMDYILESIESKKLDIIEDMESRLSKLDSISDEIENKTDNIMDIVDKRYNEFEYRLSDTIDDFKKREDDVVSNVSLKYDELTDKFNNTVEDKVKSLSELNSSVDILLSKLADFEGEVNSIRDKVDSGIESALTYKNSLEEKYNTISKDMDEKAYEYNSLINNKIKELDDKANSIFTNIEDTTFVKLDELRALIDGAILRYKDEISEIEDIRSQNKDVILNEIEDVVNKIKNDYENYASMLEGSYQNEKMAISDYVKKSIDDIEKEINLSTFNIKEMNKKDLSEYLDKYADDINSRLDEKLKSLEESRDLIGKGLEKSFITLEETINSKLDEVLNNNKAENKKAISKFIERTEELLANYDGELNEKISSSLDYMRVSDDDKIRELQNEIKDISVKIASDDRATNMLKKMESFETLFDKYLLENKNKENLFSNQIAENKNLLQESLHLLKEELEVIKMEINNKISDSVTIEDLDKIKTDITKDIDNLREDIYSKFDLIDTNLDDMIKDINSKEEIGVLSDSEKSLINIQFEGLKEDIKNLKSDIESKTQDLSENNTTDIDINSMLEDYKNDIGSKFEDFKNLIISRVDGHSNDLSSIENTLAEDKLKLLRDIDDLKVDIGILKESNSYVENISREEIEKIKDDVSGLSDNLRQLTYLEDEVEIIRTSLDKNNDSIEELKEEVREKLSSIDMDSVYYEIETLKHTLDNNLKTFKDIENKIDTKVSKDDLSYIGSELEAFKNMLENNKEYIESVKDKASKEELGILSNEIENIKLNVSESINNAHSIENGYIADIDNKINGIRDILENNKSMMEELKNKASSSLDIEYIEDELKNIKDILDLNKDYIESIKDKASNEHVSYLEEQVSNITSILEDNRAYLDVLKLKVESIDNSKFENDINSIKEDIQSNRDYITSVREQVDAIDTSAIENDINSIIDTVSANKKSIDNIENKVFDDIKYLEKEIANLQSQFENNYKMLETVKNEHNTAQLKAIEEEIQYIKTGIEGNAKYIDSIKTKANTTDVAFLEDEINSLRALIENNSNSIYDIKNLVENGGFVKQSDLEEIKNAMFDNMLKTDETKNSVEHINISIEKLKKLLTDSYGMDKEAIENLFKNENIDFENIFSKLREDIDNKLNSIKDGAVEENQKDNDNFKSLIDARISHFEDVYADPDRIKEMYKEAIDGELENIRKEAKDTLDDIALKLISIENDYDGKLSKIDDSLVLAEKKLEYFEDERLEEININIEKIKTDIDNYINKVEEKLSSQDSQIENINKLYKSFEDSINTMKEDKEKLISLLEDKEGDIETRISAIESSVSDATERMEDILFSKEEELFKRLASTEEYIKGIDSKLEKEVEEKKENIANILKSFEDSINSENAKIKSTMENYIKDVVSSELGEVKNLEDIKNAISTLEKSLRDRIEDTFIKVGSQIENNVAKFEESMKSHKEDVLDEFKRHIEIETLDLREEAMKTNSYYLKELDFSFENAKNMFEEKQDNALIEMKNFLDKVKEEYEAKLEGISSTFNSVKTSVESSMSEMKDIVKDKTNIEDYLKNTNSSIADIEEKVKLLQSEFAPAFSRIEDMVNEKSNELKNRIDNSYKVIEESEQNFRDKFVEMSDKFNLAFGERIEKIDNIVDKADTKYREVLEMLDTKMGAVLQEKESQFDAIKAHYEGVSASLYALRDSISEQVNDKIKEANSIITDNISNIEEDVEERYEKYIARLNASLENRVSDLMNEAYENVQKVNENIKTVYDSKLDNMSTIISSLENDILKTVNDAQAKIEDLDSKFNTKSEILLDNMDTKTKLLISELSKNIMEIENNSNSKYSTIEDKYLNFENKLDELSSELKKYLDDISILENAKSTTDTIQTEVEKLNKLLEDINLSKTDIEKTTEEMKHIKGMHDEIVSYMENISREREELSDTEEKVKILLELTGDMQERFTSLAQNNILIEHAEDNIKMVVDLASDVEKKLDSLRAKEGFIKETMENVESISIENDNILERIKDIKVAMIDAEEKRGEIRSKLDGLENTMNKFDKSDKKVRAVMEKFEQFDVIIEELGNQRDNLFKIKTAYDTQGQKIEDHLVRAESAIKTLDSLLKTANNLLFEDGIPKVKLSNKKDVYKGADDKADAKDELLAIELYKMGWKVEEIVKNTKFSSEDVERIINKWKNSN